MQKSSLLRTDKEITEIYYRNVQSVFRIAFMYLGNRADSEDAVQSVFMKFIDSKPYFNDEEHERAWFVTVTKNLCKNVLKSSWRIRKEDIEKAELPCYTDCYDEESEVLNEIRRLKPDYRITVYLYYYEGFSVREIAELLSKKESTVQTWLARGREGLRMELGGESHEA